MPSNLKRYYGSGDLHFVTTSCYRRQPFLGTDCGPDLVALEPQHARLQLAHSHRERAQVVLHLGFGLNDVDGGDGAEIGRAVVNFDGPIVFCVVSRYHGGAFVVFSGIAIGFMSWGVWVHHMYTTGLGTVANSAFGISTILIAIPIGVLAAWRHGETAPAMIGDRRIQIAGDEVAEHRRIDNTRERSLRAVRGSDSRAPA